MRQCLRSLIATVDASYVGNRGVWWPGPMGYLNQVSPARFAQFGLDPFHNPTDNLLLSQPLSSAAVKAKIGDFLPYPGYSTSNTLVNALRPFPQFSTITVTDSPTGQTWDDSFQVKATKRMSKGLQVNGTYTFSKALVGTRQNLFDPLSSSKSIQSTDQPHVLQLSVLYQTQKYFGNSVLSWLTRDWQVGAFARYASGLPLQPPAATVTNNLPGGNEMIRTGEPLYLKSRNCHCFDPTHEVVLNPAAWTNPVAGTYGPGPIAPPGPPPQGVFNLYYTDFRGQRRPSESVNIMRSFRLSKGDRPVMLSVRGLHEHLQPNADGRSDNVVPDGKQKRSRPVHQRLRCDQRGLRVACVPRAIQHHGQPIAPPRDGGCSRDLLAA